MESETKINTVSEHKNTPYQNLDAYSLQSTTNTFFQRDMLNDVLKPITGFQPSNFQGR